MATRPSGEGRQSLPKLLPARVHLLARFQLFVPRESRSGKTCGDAQKKGRKEGSKQANKKNEERAEDERKEEIASEK